MSKRIYEASATFLTAEEGKARFCRVHTMAQPKCQHHHCFQLRAGTQGGERRNIKEADVLEQLDVAKLVYIYTSCASSRNGWYSVIHYSNIKAMAVMHLVIINN